MGVDELFAAIERGDQDAVDAMVAGIPGIAAARNHKGTSAVLWACFVGQPEVAKVLASRLRALDVHEAAGLDRVDDLRVLLDGDPHLLDIQGDDGFRPLHLAAMFGANQAVALLLERGADVNAPARGSAQTPLHAAAFGRHHEAAGLLLAAGATVNARDAKGRTPLHAAASTGDRTMVLLLLNAGADYRLTNGTGETPADVAQHYGHRYLAEDLAP